MTDWQPTGEQLAYYDTFGYLVLPGLMKHRIEQIIAEFEGIWKARGGGHAGQPHDGKRRSCIVPFIDQTETLAGLLDDPHIHGLATAILGEDFNYMGSDGNYYAGDTGWHSDGWHTNGTKHAKIAFYLDPVTRDTGALRVVPGSHRPGDQFADALQANLGRSQDAWHTHGRDIPATALESQPGDVVIFNHNLKHAAFGGSGWRRMFTINLASRYPDELLPELRDYIRGYARFWIERAYGPTMVDTATPQRRRHLEQVMANDGHLAELARQARETMLEPSRG